LLLIVLAVGSVLLWLLQRWSRHVTALEEIIVREPIEALPQLPETGLKELDRIILVFNHLNVRFKEEREESRKLSKELARAERLAALGRMALGVAHRNPQSRCCDAFARGKCTRKVSRATCEGTTIHSARNPTAGRSARTSADHSQIG
jgi:hypothetical protein